MKLFSAGYFAFLFAVLVVALACTFAIASTTLTKQEVIAKLRAFLEDKTPEVFADVDAYPGDTGEAKARKEKQVISIFPDALDGLPEITYDEEFLEKAEKDALKLLEVQRFIAGFSDERVKEQVGEFLSAFKDAVSHPPLDYAEAAALKKEFVEEEKIVASEMKEILASRECVIIKRFFPEYIKKAVNQIMVPLGNTGQVGSDFRKKMEVEYLSLTLANIILSAEVAEFSLAEIGTDNLYYGQRLPREFKLALHKTREDIRGYLLSLMVSKDNKVEFYGPPDGQVLSWYWSAEKFVLADKKKSEAILAKAVAAGIPEILSKEPRKSYTLNLSATEESSLRIPRDEQMTEQGAR